MPCRRHSVLIVGGGPAGLSTAIELARLSTSVLVLERSRYDDVRLGEHLRPSGVLHLQAVERSLELPLNNVHFATRGIEAYWGSAAPNYTDYYFHPVQHGLNLSRPRFDADYAAAAERAGVTVLRSATLARARKTSAGWDAEIVVDGETKRCAVSVVVDASGRAAKFARSQGSKIRAGDRQVAVVSIGPSVSDRPVDRNLLESAEIGWWYNSCVSPTESICMFVTDDDLLPRSTRRGLQQWWTSNLEQTEQIRLRTPRPEPSQRLIVRSARSQHLDVASGPGWLAVGDAAMAIDPLASQGIINAIDEGRRAASAIADYISGDMSSLAALTSQSLGRYSSYWQTRRQYYRLERRWQKSLFWRRRQEDLKRNVRRASAGKKAAAKRK